MKLARSVLGAAFALACALAPAAAADPWEMPDDAAMAMRDPDRFAWLQFVALTWPANVDTRAADTAKAYGADGPVVFETWALKDQVYLAGGAKPPAWDDLPFATRALDGKPLAKLVALFRQVDPVPPGSDADQHEEVRMNRAAFDYIRSGGIYSKEGQQRVYYAGGTIAFPPDAIEVKAAWRAIDEADKPRYQWADLTDPTSGKTVTYGLTALHVLSKVLPNGHWATFEHVDNPYRMGIHDEGWLNPSRDSLACPRDNLACNLAPKGIGLEGTHWENYRLRGTQIDYIDAFGNPTILANSQLETGIQPTSSCMSCHARASIGPNRNVAASFADSKAHPPAPPTAMGPDVVKFMPDGTVEGYVGPPEPGSFLLPGQQPGGMQTYMRLDFVWSLRNARSAASPTTE